MVLLHRQRVEHLGGALDIASTQGKGTTFTIRFPLTLAVLDAFTVERAFGNGDAGEDQVRALALAAFDAAGCSGWGRVDLMRNRAGEFFLLEVNTTPGMTSHSLVPKAARAVGIEFEELCWRILETSFSGEAQP